MAKLYNLARVRTATTGTGTMTLGSAVTGFLTFAQAGVSNGDVVAYSIRDGASSEIGYGTYTSASLTLSRTVRKSTNSDALISLSGNAEVLITPSAADLVTVIGTDSVPPSDDGGQLGTTALKWSDLFLAAGAVINLNSGDVTITHSTNTLTFGGAASGYAFTGGPVVPATNDVAALGTASLQWSDLFLAEGGVINWDGGDVTITQTGNVLSFAGASTRYEYDANVTPSASDGAALGTASLMWSDLFLASGAVINLNNGDVLLTHSADLLTLTGGGWAVTNAGLATTLTNTTDSNSNEVLRLKNSNATRANNDGIYQSFWLKNSAGTDTEFARQFGVAEVVTNGSEDGRFTWQVMDAGVMTSKLRLSKVALYPSANDGLSLGISGNAVSDVYLATGAVMDWGAANVVLTHSSGILTLGTGEMRITTPGTNSASVVTIGGTQTLTNKTLTSPTLTTPAIGAATGASLAATGALTSSGTAGIGYATGAGGTITQQTNKSTTVQLDKTTGQITMNGAALNAGVIVSFTLTNSTIAATDVLVLNHVLTGTLGAYLLNAQAAAGSAVISVRNTTAGNLSEAIVIGFVVIKGVTS